MALGGGFLKRILAYLGVMVLLVLSLAQTKLYIGNMDTMVFKEGAKGYLAVIIDDFGYSGEGTDEILALDSNITAAVMPFSGRTNEDLEKIKAAGKEYIIHMPMESLTGDKAWVGDKGVFLSMTDDEIKAVTKEAIDIIDGAAGMNNHMGSAITTNEEKISLVFEVLGDKGLFFIDSVTVPDTLTEKIGEKYGVEVLKRDVFLDSTDDIEVIKKNILKAGEIALENGTAIAIGHVGPEGGIVTAEALKETLPELEKMGVELVSASEMREIIKGGN